MIKNKNEALNRFVKEIRELLKDKILAIYHFGSTAKEEIDTPDSDIDVLIVFTNIGERELLNIVSEISFEIACDTGEVIEPVLISESEYKEGMGKSPFLWEAVVNGRPIFTNITGTEWKLDFADYIKLSLEYLGYAKDALKENKLRLTIDTGYNACELLVKAMILSKGETLASSYGGVIGQFGKLFVVTKLVDREIGKNLHLALELRAKARYKLHVQISKEDAEFVLSLAEKILELAEKIIKI